MLVPFHECHGFHMYQGGMPIKDFKTKVILDGIEENGWDEIHFYEDRQDWLHHAEGAVKEKYPNINFITHFLSDVKDQHKFE